MTSLLGGPKNNYFFVLISLGKTVCFINLILYLQDRNKLPQFDDLIDLEFEPKTTGSCPVRGIEPYGVRAPA